MATIRKRDSGRWQVQIRRIGLKPISKSFIVLKDARAWARQMEVQADRSELPSDPKILKQLTLGQLVIRYRDTVSTRKRTCHAERIVLTAFLRRPICSRRLSELRTEHFAEYRDERLRDIKPSSLRRELTPIRHLFEVAQREWGLPIRQNPLQNLSLDSADDRRERRLRAGELRQIIDATRSCRNPLIAPIVMFALLSAMRRGEILSIRWADIDDQTGSLVIPEAKNGFARTIPLVPAAFQILRSLPSTEDRVFPLSANGFRLAWERLKRRAGIEDLHFHDLRHEAISRFFELGLSVPEVALISGHRDARMLFRYTHPLREKIRARLIEQIPDEISQSVVRLSAKGSEQWLLSRAQETIPADQSN